MDVAAGLRRVVERSGRLIASDIRTDFTFPDDTYPQLMSKNILDKQGIMYLNAAFDSNTGYLK